MNAVAQIIADLVGAGVPAELIGRVASALASREVVVVRDEAAERRREKDRDRKRDVRGIPQTSADSADTEGQKEIPPKPPKEKLTPLPQTGTEVPLPEGGSPELDLLPDADADEAKVKPKRKGRLPADWQPSAENLEYAAKIALRADETAEEAEKFRDWATANGEVKSDWDAAWRNWCRKAVEYRARGSPRLKVVNSPLLDADGNEIHDEPRGRRSDGKGRFTDTFDATLLALERASGR